MADSLIVLDHVSRHFFLGGERISALLDASCTVRTGDRIAIMGPSGSGKSTLLALMAKLDEPSEGRISWPSVDGSNYLRPRHIGVAFQSSSLIQSLSVIENVEVPLLILGETSDMQKRAMAVLGLVGIGGLADRLAEDLSGGQAQRVGLARALVSNPKIILADEPTGQLDQETARDLVRALQTHAEKTGAALVIATHDPSVAQHMKFTWRMDYGLLTTSRMADVVS
jgi:ABC-type lipoprotein export system ATPase subunit